MGLYAIDQYSASSWYDAIGAYDLSTGTDLLLDQTRYIIESDAYVFRGHTFPKSDDINLQVGQTFSGTLNLIPYSYIISLTGFTDNENQFVVRIFDKGAQTDVYQKQFGWFPAVVSNMQGLGQSNVGQQFSRNFPNQPFGPYFFRDPLIVLPPGVLQIQVTNVFGTNNVIPTSGASQVQLFFNVAVPKNTISYLNRKVLTSNDQTGTQTIQGDFAVIQQVLGLGKP